VRITNPEFTEKNVADSREPVFVVELSFDDLNTDVHYLTGSPVTGLTGNIINNTLKVVGSTSQRINPEKANSTIGSIRFECLDIGLTDLQRSKLAEDKGLNGKRVRVHQGFKGLNWDTFEPIETQVIDSSIQYKDGVYKFQCADIQREMRKDIFDTVETTLRESLGPDDTVLKVYDTSKFQAVYQVPSPSGKTVLRALQARGDVDNTIDDVGFLEWKGENDEKEIAMWISKTSDEFTLVRGVLGTRPIALDLSSDNNADNAPKIKEYVYMEMSAIKTAYAIQTGSFYGHAGKFLPDHWHLGISTDYIKTSSFVNIGDDLWDLTDDDKGYAAVIRGAEKTDGKKFVEQNLLYMVGAYQSVNEFGELDVKRVQEVGALGSYTRELNETNVTKYSDLTHDLKSVVNRYVIKWNRDERKDDTTRVSAFIDPVSIERHKVRKTKTLKLPTLHGSRHSYSVIKYHFDAIRTRTASPPLRLTLDATPDQNDLRVGDIVRVNLPNIEDPTNDTAGLNRNFEIQSVKHNWKTGGVTFTLFGSSEKVSDVTPEDTETVGTTIADFGTAFANGTEINATNFPGAVSSSGGVTTISGDVTFTGNYVLVDPTSIYYCNEDLTIDGGATVSIDDNVIIATPGGFFQHNGKIDGKGRGFPGGAVYNSYGVPTDSQHFGSAGIGNTSPQGGIAYYISDYGGASIHLEPRGITKDDGAGGVISLVVEGLTNSVQRPLLSLNDDGLNGLPSNLMGSSGSCGVAVWDISGGSNFRVAGGSGGNGGAGLCIISAGMAFGAAAEIDLSGDDGAPGGYYNHAGQDVRLHAGAGAGGHTGGLIYINTDSVQNTPTFDADHVLLENGQCPVQAKLRRNYARYSLLFSDYECSSYYGGRLYGSRENTVGQNHSVIFLDTSSAPVEDVPVYVETPPTFTLTAQANTPVSPIGDRSTIEVSVTPPADENYSYSEVDYKRSDKDVWISADPASNESLIEVPSAGATFDVRVRPVSKAGVASPSGEVKQITVVDRNGRTNTELAAVYPFAALTGFQLVTGGTTFIGLDCDVTWSDDNAELTYFNHYEIEVYDGATLLRTEQSVSPFYVYTYEKNRADYYAQNATVGVYLAVEIRVKTVSKYRNNVNALYATSAVALTFTATTAEDPQNLRFYTHVVNKPELGSNLLYNGDLSLVGANGSPAGLLATNNDSHVISYFDAEKTIAAISGTDSGPVGLPAFRVIQGTTYRLFVRARTTIAKASGFYIRVREFNGELAQGFTHVGGSAVSSPIAGYDSQSQWTSGPDFENIGLGTTWEDFEVEYTPPAGVTWATLSVWKNWSANDALLIDRMEVASLADQTDYDDDRVNNNNATGFTLVPTSDMRVTGARVECLSGGAWDNSVRSVEGFTGGAFLSFRVPQTNKRIMFGLDTNPTEDDDYQNIDALFYLRNDGTYQARVNGVLVYGSVAYVAGDIFSITYDNVNVRWYVNGALVWTHAVTDGLTLYIDSSFLDGNAVIESIQFGPYQSNNWDDVGGTNRPADNATEGATWGGDISGQPDRQNVLNNQIDITDWESGGALPSNLSTSSYGYTTSNSLVVEEGPTGFDEVCWKVQHASAATDAGGFSFRSSVKINPAKVYRVTCWFKTSSSAGVLRFSPSNNSIVRELDTDTVQTSPYQHVAATPQQNKWLLAVMVIHPHNTGRVSTSGKSGIYDPETGDVIEYFDEFKFIPSADSLRSAFQYNDTNNTTSSTLFARPRLEVIDGTEARIESLLGPKADKFAETEFLPIIFGVTSAGAKITSNGSGITTARTATGDYRLNHSSGFSGFPKIVTPESSNVDRIGVTDSVGYIRVRFYDVNNNAIDSAFSVMVDYRYGT